MVFNNGMLINFGFVQITNSTRQEVVLPCTYKNFYLCSATSCPGPSNHGEGYCAWVWNKTLTKITITNKEYGTDVSTRVDYICIGS